MSQWIKTTEQLPPVETDVLMLCDGSIYHASMEWERPTFEETFNPYRYFMTIDQEELDWDRVSHWMPLPEMPEDTNSN